MALGTTRLVAARAEAYLMVAELGDLGVAVHTAGGDGCQQAALEAAAEAAEEAAPP